MHLLFFLSPVTYRCINLSSYSLFCLFLFFFFNDTATTEIYTLSLHDALPIYQVHMINFDQGGSGAASADLGGRRIIRSEEHTSELQSLTNLVCRLLLEKKKQ